MFGRVVNVAAEGRAEVGVIAGGIGDEIIAPVVEDASVRVGKAIGGVALEFAGAGTNRQMQASSLRTGPCGGFDLGAMENAVAEITVPPPGS